MTAFRILARGGAVVMYCEGGRSRTGKIADEARPGIGRLALESGAPVVPVAILGSYQVRNWKRLQFPKVTVQYGEAVPVRAVARLDPRAAAGGRGRHPRTHEDAARRARASRPRGALQAARESAKQDREAR